VPVPLVRPAPLTALVLLMALLLGAGCTYVSVDAGYFAADLDGDVGVDSAALATTLGVDVDSSLALSGISGSPWARLQAGNERVGVTLSGFHYDQQGRGVLEADFGNIRLGTPVDSDMTLDSVKAALHFDLADIIGVEGLHVRPGIAADAFFPDLTVRSVLQPDVVETVDEPIAVPLAYLEVDYAVGPVSLIVDAGYMSLDYDAGSYDVGGSLLDLGAMVRVRPWCHVHLFAGYRFLDLDVEGTADGDPFEADLQLRGWILGGGVAF
jgi:hypothetical protein